MAHPSRSQPIPSWCALTWASFVLNPRIQTRSRAPACDDGTKCHCPHLSAPQLLSHSLPGGYCATNAFIGWVPPPITAEHLRHRRAFRFSRMLRHEHRLGNTTLAAAGRVLSLITSTRFSFATHTRERTLVHIRRTRRYSLYTIVLRLAAATKLRIYRRPSVSVVTFDTHSRTSSGAHRWDQRIPIGLSHRTIQHCC